VTVGRIGDAEHGAQAFGMAGAGMVPDTGAADGFHAAIPAACMHALQARMPLCRQPIREADSRRV